MSTNNQTDVELTPVKLAEARQRRLEAMHLQAIEDNALSADQIAMFEMFEREAWPHERRIAYIKQRAATIPLTSAAE